MAHPSPTRGKPVAHALEAADLRPKATPRSPERERSFTPSRESSEPSAHTNGATGEGQLAPTQPAAPLGSATAMALRIPPVVGADDVSRCAPRTPPQA